MGMTASAVSAIRLCLQLRTRLALPLASEWGCAMNINGNSWMSLLNEAGRFSCRHQLPHINVWLYSEVLRPLCASNFGVQITPTADAANAYFGCFDDPFGTSRRSLQLISTRPICQTLATGLSRSTSGVCIRDAVSDSVMRMLLLLLCHFPWWCGFRWSGNWGDR